MSTDQTHNTDGQRERLVAAIDKLHEEATVGSRTSCENAAIGLARALGWHTDDDLDQPFGDWVRARLREVLR